jgi:uncharacterized lipoprotein YbaY/heat shock protein HslJ
MQTRTPLTAMLAASLVLIAGGCMSSTAPTQSSTVTGTATFRERMALPPGAVFEATLEDVSRADTPAEILGSTRKASPGNPPFAFSIEYDPSRIDPSHQYAVRAQVIVDGRPMFVTDTRHPVLTAGHPATVDIVMKRASSSAPVTAAAAAGQSASARRQGLYTYMADAGMFVDCATGERLPVAQEGDNAALERAYSAARKAPGAALLAVVEGRVEVRTPMEGAARPTLIVERFVSVGEGTCGNEQSTAVLENTYWKLVRLGATPVTVAEKQQEPYFVLQPETGRVIGSGGCNRMTGSYTLSGAKLTFRQMAGTMMACLEGMDVEREFHKALQQVASWRIEGETLELFDAGGVSIAQFESRYLK